MLEQTNVSWPWSGVSNHPIAAHASCANDSHHMKNMVLLSVRVSHWDGLAGLSAPGEFLISNLRRALGTIYWKFVTRKRYLEFSLYFLGIFQPLWLLQCFLLLFHIVPWALKGGLWWRHPRLGLSIFTFFMFSLSRWWWLILTERYWFQGIAGCH